MGKRRKDRLYVRERGGVRRWYADFRDFANVGGGREALIADGEKSATTDETVAQILAARRLEELDARRNGRAIHGDEKHATLAQFARQHLIAKAEEGAVTDSWLEATEAFLERAIEFWGAHRDLRSISVKDVRLWIADLKREPTGTGRTMGGGTVRHYLNAVSNLYRRAQGEEYVPPGYNPVASLMHKPKAQDQEARWLEVHEAALILEAARTHKPPPDANTHAHLAYPLLAVFLLTGGRKSEVLGLQVSDVSFDHKTVTFRPNEWRRLKTQTSRRSVPLWPQLEEILRPYVFGTDHPPRTLLFPSSRSDPDKMIVDFRKLLDAIAMRAGWEPGHIRSKIFRHTYCAARLQTLDRKAPISEYTVARELGHGGHAMIRRVYGHLGQVRHRSDVIEYRVEQHRERLGERVAALSA
jgi:integrase